MDRLIKLKNERKAIKSFLEEKQEYKFHIDADLCLSPGTELFDLITETLEKRLEDLERNIKIQECLRNGMNNFCFITPADSVAPDVKVINEPRWRDPEKELPETFKTVILAFDEGWRFELGYMSNSETWKVMPANTVTDVQAWLPIPDFDGFN